MAAEGAPHIPLAAVSVCLVTSNVTHSPPSLSPPTFNLRHIFPCGFFLYPISVIVKKQWTTYIAVVANMYGVKRREWPAFLLSVCGGYVSAC